MNTEQITLNPDGTVYRGDKHIATVEGDGDIKWNHYSYKAKHSEAVDSLARGFDGTDEHGPLVYGEMPAHSQKFRVKASEMSTGKSHGNTLSELSDPEPPTDFRGDRTPGYPEWFLKQNGQEEYDEKYIVKGRNRYPEKEARDYARENGSDPSPKISGEELK